MEVLNVRNLKAAMLLQGVGVTQLAKISNVQAYQLSSWLKQKQVQVRLPTISKLSKALRVPPTDLILED